MALMTTNLTAAQRQQILSYMAETAASKTLTAQQLIELSADQKLALYDAGIITAEQARTGATITLTQAELKKIVADEAMLAKDKQLILSAFGVTEANLTEASSWEILGKSAGKALLALATNPYTYLVAGLVATVVAVKNTSKAIEEVRDKAQELGDTFNTSKSEIEGYKSQIEDLYKKINDSGSSVEDITSARQTLMSVQDELIDKFGDEKETIDLVTQAINGQSSALDDLIDKQWQETKNKFNESGFWNDYANWTEGYSDNIDRMVDEMENAWGNIKMSTSDYFGGEYDDVIKRLEDAGWKYSSSSETFVKGGSVEDLYEEILEIQALVGEDMPDNFLKSLTKDANELKGTLDKYEDIWDNYILNDKIFVDENLADSWKEVNDAYTKYQNAVTSGDKSAIEEATAGFATSINEVLNNENVDDSVKDYFKDMYPVLYREVEKWEFKTNIIPEFDTSGLQGKTQADILGMLQTDGAQEGEGVFNSIVESAIEYGLIVDDNAEGIQKILDLLVEWGILQGTISDNTPDANEMTDLWLSENGKKGIDDFQSKLSSLSEALKKLKDGSLTSTDKIDLLQDFPELEGRTEDLDKAIEELIDNSLEKLFELLGDNIPEDLKKTLQSLAKESKGFAESVDVISEELDNIQSAYKTAQDAIKEYSETGKLSLDTVQALFEMDSQYFGLLIDESGNLSLTTEALKKLTLARIEDMAVARLRELIDDVRTNGAKAESLKNLSIATNDAEKAQWGLLYAEIANLEESDEVIAATYRKADAFRQLADTASQTVTTDFDFSMNGASSRDSGESIADILKEKALNELKYAIDKVKAEIDETADEIDILDDHLELTFEDDFVERIELTSDKLSLVTQHGAELRAEFERLSQIEPTTAAEAQELQSRMEELGQQIQENIQDVRELTLELVQLRVDALTSISKNALSKFKHEFNIINNSIQAMSGQSLMGMNFSVLPVIPKDVVEQQREINDRLIAEEKRYQEEIWKIRKKYIELDKAEKDKDIAERLSKASGGSGSGGYSSGAYGTSSGGYTGGYSSNYNTSGSSGSGGNGITPAKKNVEKPEITLSEDETSKAGRKIVEVAMGFLGTPYVWGGTTPKGFDCSGLVHYVYNQVGEEISGTTYTQIKDGKPIGKDGLKEGDLVFFSSNGTDVDHVGIYAGGGQFIHSPHTGDVVKFSSLDSDYYENHYVGARRIVEAESYNPKETPKTNGTTTASSWSAEKLKKTDLTQLPKLTADQIETVIEKFFTPKNSVVKSGDAKGIYDAQTQSGISALALLGIGALESGYGTSNIAKKKGNLWGWGAVNSNPMGGAKTFSDEVGQAAIEYANNLKSLYYDERGAKSIYAIGTGDNPSGLGYAYNDDGSISTTWANDIGSIMKQFIDVAGDLAILNPDEIAETISEENSIVDNPKTIEQLIAEELEDAKRAGAIKSVNSKKEDIDKTLSEYERLKSRINEIANDGSLERDEKINKIKQLQGKQEDSKLKILELTGELLEDAKAIEGNKSEDLYNEMRAFASETFSSLKDNDVSKNDVNKFVDAVEKSNKASKEIQEKIGKFGEKAKDIYSGYDVLQQRIDKTMSDSSITDEVKQREVKLLQEHQNALKTQVFDMTSELLEIAKNLNRDDVDAKKLYDEVQNFAKEAINLGKQEEKKTSPILADTFVEDIEKRKKIADIDISFNRKQDEDNKKFTSSVTERLDTLFGKVEKGLESTWQKITQTNDKIKKDIEETVNWAGDHPINIRVDGEDGYFNSFNDNNSGYSFGNGYTPSNGNGSRYSSNSPSKKSPTQPTNGSSSSKSVDTPANIRKAVTDTWSKSKETTTKTQEKSFTQKVKDTVKSVANKAKTFIKNIFGHADGTDEYGLPDSGVVITGEKGVEGGILPDGTAIELKKGLVDLPEGTQILTHEQYNEVKKYEGRFKGQKIPRYATGTGVKIPNPNELLGMPIGEAAKVLADAFKAQYEEIIRNHVSFNNLKGISLSNEAEIDSKIKEHVTKTGQAISIEEMQKMAGELSVGMPSTLDGNIEQDVEKYLADRQKKEADKAKQEQEYLAKFDMYIQEVVDKAQEFTVEELKHWRELDKRIDPITEKAHSGLDEIRAKGGTTEARADTSRLYKEVSSDYYSLMKETMEWQKSNILRSYKEQMDILDKMYEHFDMRSKAEDVTADELKFLKEGIEKQQSAMSELSDAYIEAANQISDFVINTFKNSQLQYQSINSYMDRNISDAERELNNSTEIVKKNEAYDKLISSHNEKASTGELKKNQAHEARVKWQEEKLNPDTAVNPQYEQYKKMFETVDFEALFDANGDFTKDVDNILKAYQDDFNIDSTLLRNLLNEMQIYKQSFFEGLNEMIEAEDDALEATRNQQDLKVSLWTEYLERQAEIYDFIYNREQAIIDSTKSEYELRQQIRQSISDANNTLIANKELEQWLDPETRKLLFNDDDYSNLISEYETIQKAIETDTAAYQAKIESLTEDEWYKQEQITAAYQAQLEAHRETLEVVTKEMNVAKKRLEYENRAKERDTQIILGNRIVNVADPDALHTLAMEKAELESDYNNTLAKNAENQEIRDMQEVNNKTKAQATALQANADMWNDMTDEQRRALSKNLPLFEEIASALSSLTTLDPKQIRDFAYNAVRDSFLDLRSRDDIGYGTDITQDYSALENLVKTMTERGVISKSYGEELLKHIDDARESKRAVDHDFFQYFPMYNGGRIREQDIYMTDEEVDATQDLYLKRYGEADDYQNKINKILEDAKGREFFPTEMDELRRLETERNRKIYENGLAYKQTHDYGGKEFSDWIDGDYSASIDKMEKRIALAGRKPTEAEIELLRLWEKHRNAKIDNDGLPYEKTYKYNFGAPVNLEIPANREFILDGVTFKASKDFNSNEYTTDKIASGELIPLAPYGYLKKNTSTVESEGGIITDKAVVEGAVRSEFEYWLSPLEPFFSHIENAGATMFSLKPVAGTSPFLRSINDGVTNYNFGDIVITEPVNNANDVMREFTKQLSSKIETTNNMSHN